MRPPRPVPPLPRPLVVGLVVVLGGCVSSGARWERLDQYLDTAAVAPAAGAPAPTCRNGRGRVDDRMWRERVGTFEGRPYRDRATFRAAKQDLLRDLAAIRDRACAWEMRFVDDLVARVQARTWKDAGPHRRPWLS